MPNTFLRRVLAIDAITGAASGVLLLAGAGVLAPMLNLQREILLAGGVLIAPFAALLAWLALQSNPPRTGVWFVIAVNAAWVLVSIALLVTGIERPNALGYAFVIVQAFAVGVLAELEYVGLKRAARAA